MEVVMFSCKLRFFYQKNVEQQNKEANLNRLTLRLKELNLTKMLSEQQTNKIIKLKKKKLAVKFNLRRRRARAPLILPKRAEVSEHKEQESKIFHCP